MARLNLKKKKNHITYHPKTAKYTFTQNKYIKEIQNPPFSPLMGAVMVDLTFKKTQKIPDLKKIIQLIFERFQTILSPLEVYQKTPKTHLLPVQNFFCIFEARQERGES